MVTTLHIRILGDFSVIRDEQLVTGISTARLQMLIAYLILNRETPRSRQQIAFQFWPDSSEAQARTNLRQLIHQLRRVLPNADSYLQMDAQTLQWRADAPCRVDVVDFRRAVQRADEAEDRGNDRERASALEEATRHYGGDLLPGHYDEWLLSERDALRDLYTGVLERLIRYHEEQRDYPGAILHAKALLRHDSLREATYRDLIRLHSLEGDRAAALQVYKTCESVLQRELGTGPGPATRTAYLTARESEKLPSHEPAGGATSSTTPLVGRDDAWRQLLADWHVASSSGPRLMLLTGEAGIGKTRLAEELLAWADQQGIATARARSYQTEGRLAYGAVTDCLRSPDIYPTLSRLDSVWQTEVARLLPELLAEQPDLPPPEPIREGWQRQRLFTALARAIGGVERPLVVLIDDLQWSDQDTLEWLHYLLRFDSEARLLVVGTVRGEEVSPRDPLQALILELRRKDLLTELAVEPLDAQATAQLAEQVKGTEIDVATADRLYRDTEGNPLFIVETIRAGDKTSMAEDAPDASNATTSHTAVDVLAPLPPRVQAVISARLAQLSPAANDLARLLATVGHATTSAVLTEASEGDEDEVVDALDELWQRQIVREQAEGLFYLSHEKIREVAYAEISPARRRLLHRRVARALERIYGANLDRVSGQLAAHYERAGEVDRVVAYYQRAAEAAQEVDANVEAISLLRRGLAALARLPESAERDHRELALQTALSVSLNALKTFDAPRADESYGAELDQVYARVSELSQRLGVPVDSRMLRAMALVLITSGEVRQALVLGEQLLDIARQAADDPVLYAEAYYTIGAASHWLGRFRSAREYLELALAYYDRQRHRIHVVQYAQDPGAICLSRLAYTLLYLGYPAQARRHLDTALTLARELAHPQSLAYTLNYVSLMALELRDVQTTREGAEEMMELARASGLGTWQLLGDANLGWAQVQSGEAREGIERIRQGLSGDYATGQLLHAPLALALLTDAYRLQGAADAGLAAVAEGFRLVKRTGVQYIESELYRLKGELLRLRGASDDDAEAAFHHALEIARAQEARLPELRAATALARLLHDQGRGVEGRQTLQAIYDWFTEGFDTPDLREARDLLNELAP